MGKLTVLALRAVLVVLLAGSVFVQAVMVPLLAIDMQELDAEIAYLRTPLLLIILLGVVTVQIVLVCVWRLVTMVRRGTVFSHGAFRYVDIVIGAIVAAAALIFALAVLLASMNWVSAGDDYVAPGMVLLICGLGVAALGVALVVVVLRMLLAQAVAREVEAAQLQAELDEVI
ncbi:MAG: DUF2975 domain-containing protein [Micromonosporaceae bacterium]